jgi:RNA polymerase sigma-70 factor, ECF subfamily
MLNTLAIELPLDESLSEELLLKLAISRNETAFSRLYEIYMKRLYRYVSFWVNSQAEAEDITQEVFIRAWKSIHKYQVKGVPFVAWLITIARNLINDHHRSRKRKQLRETEAAANFNLAEVSPVEIAESNLDSQAVRRAIMKLKGDRRKVIMMHFIEGFEYSEIAVSMKKSEGAVRVIQYRALSDLKKLIDRANKV